MLVFLRRWVHALSCMLAVTGILAGTIGTAGAEEEKYDSKRADEIKTILKEMPEFRAVERVLAGAAPTLAKLGASNNLHYTSEDFAAKTATFLAIVETREQRTLKNDEILLGLNFQTQAFVPEVGCFVAFAEHPSLASQWQALAPLLVIDDYITWTPVTKVVNEQCKTAIDTAIAKPEGGTATLWFEFGEHTGQKILSDQPFSLIVTIAENGFFDARSVLSSHQRILKAHLDLQDKIVTGSLPIIQGLNPRLRNIRYRFASLMCRFESRYCDLRDVFNANNNASASCLKNHTR